MALLTVASPVSSTGFGIRLVPDGEGNLGQIHNRTGPLELDLNHTEDAIQNSSPIVFWRVTKVPQSGIRHFEGSQSSMIPC